MRISRMEDFGGSVPASEAVDVNLPAVGAGGGTRQSAEFRLKVVGIVREGIQGVAADDRGTRVVFRVDAQLTVSVVTLTC